MLLICFARDFDEFPTVKRKAVRVIQYEGSSRLAMVRERDFKRGYAVGFEDRIEFTNPGGPLVEVYRLVNDPPRSRNEKLSALMRRLGVCEEAGTGWDKIIAACEEARLPAPRIEAREDVSMRVMLFGRTAFKDLSPKERLDACYWHTCICYANGGYASNASLRERFGLGQSGSAQVSRLIKEAVAQGLVKPVDPTTAPRYMRYEPAWV